MEFYADPSVMEAALQRFAAGEESEGCRWLGCHALPGQGYVFRVWAPTATAVSLVGDFNAWDAASHPLEPLGQGVWECACQQAAAYLPYKYHIVEENGQAVEVTDPFGTEMEAAPGAAGLVCQPGGYVWRHSPLRKTRANTPLNVYRVPAAGWRRFGDGRPFDFVMLTEQLVPYVAKMGYTHLLLEGISAKDTLAPRPVLGSPQQLMGLVDACHDVGIEVLLEWALPEGATFDIPPQCSGWLSGARYWLDNYALDGLVVPIADTLFLDGGHTEQVWATNPQGGRENRQAVAFWRRFTATLKEACPGVLLLATGGDVWHGTTAEDAPDGLGFTHVLATDWAADMARYTALPFPRRGRYPQLLTACLLHPFAQQYVLPLAPDGAVYPAGAMPGEYTQRLAGLRALMGYQMAHPGGKLTTAGVEYGQLAGAASGEPPDWLLLDYEEHRMLQHYAATLNRLYRDTPALWQQDTGWEGLRWISDEEAAKGVLAFYRQPVEGPPLVVVLNMQDVPYEEYSLGLPLAGEWVEVLGSDLVEFGGQSAAGRRLEAWPMPLGGQPASLKLTLPPLSVLFLQPADA